MGQVVGTLIGFAVLGGIVYGPVRVLLTRRYPRKPSDHNEPT